MKIRELINRVENFKQPNWDLKQQLEWINQIEKTILEDIIKKHMIPLPELDKQFHCVVIEEPTEENQLHHHHGHLHHFVKFDYIENHESIDEDLFCPDRYCDFYMYWLLAKIDEVNGDLTRFSNDMAMYQSYYLEFGNYVNRTYRHYPVKLRY